MDLGAARRRRPIEQELVHRHGRLAELSSNTRIADNPENWRRAARSLQRDQVADSHASRRQRGMAPWNDDRGERG